MQVYCSSARSSAQATSTAPVDASAVSHDECIALDQVDVMQFIMTNTLTAERYKLPPGEWHLEVDADSGEGAVYQPSSPEHPDGRFMFVDELLKKVVYKHPEGELFLTIGDSLPHRSLSVWRTRFSPGSVVVQAGFSSAKYDLNVFVFHLPRAADQRMFWEIGQFYTCLAMQTHQGSRCSPPVCACAHPRDSPEGRHLAKGRMAQQG